MAQEHQKQDLTSAGTARWLRVLLKILASIVAYIAVWVAVDFALRPLLPVGPVEPEFFGFVLLVGALSFIWADEVARSVGRRLKFDWSTVLLKILASVAVYILVMLAISAGVDLYFGANRPELVQWRDLLSTIAIPFLAGISVFIWLR